MSLIEAHAALDKHVVQGIAQPKEGLIASPKYHTHGPKLGPF